MSQRRREIARAPKGRQNHLASRDFCRPFGAKIIELHLLVDPKADALGYGLTPPPGAQEPSPDSLLDQSRGPGASRVRWLDGFNRVETALTLIPAAIR